jgi:hypothetical protein
MDTKSTKKLTAAAAFVSRLAVLVAALEQLARVIGL